MIDWNFTPYAVPLFVGVAIMLGVLIVLWQRRTVRGSQAMALLMFAVMIYALAYALELGSSSLADAKLWLRIEYIGITSAIVLMVILVIIYAGYDYWQTTLNYLILALIPAMTLFFAWTSDYHDWMWQDLHLERVGQDWRVDFNPGPWYMIHVIYVVVLMAISLVMLLRALGRETGLYRQQLVILLAGYCVPALTFLLYLTGIVGGNLDLNPYAQLLTAIILVWGILNYHIFDIAPVARELVLADMADAVIVIDLRDRMVYANPAARQLVCDKRPDCIGISITEIFPELADVLTAYGGETTARAEVVVEAGKAARFYDIRLSQLHRGPGKLSGRLIVMRDISDRVQAQTALGDTNLRLMTLRQVDAELNRRLDLDYVADIAIDAAMRVSLAEAAIIGLLEPEGVRVIRALGPYPQSLLNGVIPLDIGVSGRALRNREAIFVSDITQDADYVAYAPKMRAQITVPLLSGRKLIGLFTLETSSQDRFNTEVFETLKLLAAHVAIAMDNAYYSAEREKLVKELDSYARTVAHDLKNPLASITGYAGLLVDNFDTLPDEQKKSFAQTILRNAEKSADIINALLMLARVRHSQDVEIHGLDTPKIIQDVCVRLQPLIDERQVQIRQPESWPAALGYGPWVEEIWANYISNGIKYGGSPAVVQVGADELPGGKVRFWVKDNGSGLSKEDQSRLFRPFTRLGQTDAAGHGLGLSIVLSIVERLRGEAGVESEIGWGSTFYFTLPAMPKSL
ncbi:MAG: GAF domain-containing protein [Chloroflexi bacterium]|nr:GAF domain-containing protein [Chloroflexota bacterium]